MKERIVYDTQQAVADLLRFQSQAEERGDSTNAIKATVEALEVQGKYVTHSESVYVQITTEDRMRAKVLGMGLNEYVKRKQEGKLPPLPESVTKH